MSLEEPFACTAIQSCVAVFLFIISVLFSAAGTALNFVVLVSVTVTTL